MESVYRTNTVHTTGNEVKFIVGYIGSDLAHNLGYFVEHRHSSSPHYAYVPVEDAKAFDEMHVQEIFNRTGKRI